MIIVYNETQSIYEVYDYDRKFIAWSKHLDVLKTAYPDAELQL